jgi:hypothetical protein
MTELEWCFDSSKRLCFEMTSRYKNKGAIPAVCQGLCFPDKCSPSNMRLVRYDAKGKPVIFDASANGLDKFAVPFRWEADYQGSALPPDNLTGNLYFTADNVSTSQSYALYYDIGESIEPQYGGIVGDGDCLTMQNGPLAVPGLARPVYYGDKLFGKQGMLVGSSYDFGIYFFEGDINSEKALVRRGPLKDKNSNIIAGIPYFYDFTGNGSLDIIIGANNGKINLYRNLADNQKPVYEDTGSLKLKTGGSLDVKPMLTGKTMRVIRADGTENPDYPEMPLIVSHGGHVHIYSTPVIVNWSGQDDLLVGTKGGFLIYFKRNGDSFAEGKIVLDENGRELDCGTASAFISTINNEGLTELAASSLHGFLHHIKFFAFDNDVPMATMRQSVEKLTEKTNIFPLLCGNKLLLGSAAGDIELFETKHEFSDLRFYRKNMLKAYNATINHRMTTVYYTDMNGDGNTGVLSGDIQGGLFYYKNIGTKRSPLFGIPLQLSDQDGLIKINEGPDPLESHDGYTKPFPVRLDQKQKGVDILCGTGLGDILWWENLGNNKFKYHGPLKDTEETPVKCHHMSAVCVNDWTGDGIPDLIVSGQAKVHAHPDSDKDESQVRLYQGQISSEEKLEFTPYEAFSNRGDLVFAYRPIPPAVITNDDQKMLYAGGRIYSKAGENPANVEFYQDWQYPLKNATQNYLAAYPAWNELAPGDKAVFMSSCVGPVHVFRQNFMDNCGYLDAEFRLVDENKLITKASPKYPTSPSVEVVNKLAEKSSDIIVNLDRSPEQLNLEVINIESTPSRMICQCKHNFGPVYHDDHIDVILDLGQDFEYLLQINPKGYYNFSRLDKRTGLSHYTDCIDSIFVESVIATDKWTAKISLPFKSSDSFLLEVKRHRALYANQIKASEQRIAETISWSGLKNGRIRITKGYT